MLYECKEKYVPLTKEIEQLNNFIKLNKLQIEERGIVNFKTENISSDYKIAPLILIIFIENAFKHSQSGQTDSIVIDIDIRLKGNILQFYSKNNFEATKTLDTVDNGIGLENVKKRLQLLYPEKHKLTINDEGRSYEVNLSLELEKIQMQ
jgi:LytS/YehU family sensor histidine kinase